MGYNTSFTLTLLEGVLECDKLDIINKFREGYPDAKYAIDIDGGFRDDCKWYNHEEDLKEFSSKNPGILFLLEGVGEENGDQWKMYVLNGHSQYCKAEIVFPEFDRGKLIADIRDSKLKNIGI